MGGRTPAAGQAASRPGEGASPSPDDTAAAEAARPPQAGQESGEQMGEGDGKNELVGATVAPGRTVVVDGVSHGPGREVRLPPREVKRLRRSGALVDPDAPALPRSNGAVFAKR